jgi:hypothetical protein
MDSDIAQLVEMVCLSNRDQKMPGGQIDGTIVQQQGATVSQARAALKKYPDVMEAASQIFEGEFAHVVDDDGDGSMDDATAGSSTGSGSKRKATNIVSSGIHFPATWISHGWNGMKAPDDSDDDDAVDDGDDEDFDGMSRQILAISPRLNSYDRMQITTMTLVQRWTSRRMDTRVPQIHTLVGPPSPHKPWSGGVVANQIPRYFLFQGQTRGSHRS